jgi:hypothetical protein
MPILLDLEPKQSDALQQTDAKLARRDPWPRWAL